MVRDIPSSKELLPFRPKTGKRLGTPDETFNTPEPKTKAQALDALSYILFAELMGSELMANGVSHHSLVYQPFLKANGVRLMGSATILWSTNLS